MKRPTTEQLRRMGQSLREIDRRMLNADPAEGPVRWFLGENGTEITAWVNEQGIPHHIQLIFWQVSVEWTERSLSTGAFDARGSTAGGRYDAYLLRVSGGLDREVCEAAVELLEASDLAEGVKQPLLSALENAAQVAPESETGDGDGEGDASDP